MRHAEAVRDLLAPSLPASFDWQFGRWEDSTPSRRKAVLRPAGGVGAELIRRPQFVLSLVGLRGGDHAELGQAADTIVETCRADAGDLVYVEAGEPVYVLAADGRPIFEIALSVIAN